MADVPQEPAKDEDEVHRKFREALERKAAARSGSQRPGPRTTASGVGPASNDKSKRQFRRKSG
jgi:hypothetical protein